MLWTSFTIIWQRTACCRGNDVTSVTIADVATSLHWDHVQEGGTKQLSVEIKEEGEWLCTHDWMSEHREYWVKGAAGWDASWGGNKGTKNKEQLKGALKLLTHYKRTWSVGGHYNLLTWLYIKVAKKKTTRSSYWPIKTVSFWADEETVDIN